MRNLDQSKLVLFCVGTLLDCGVRMRNALDLSTAKANGPSFMRVLLAVAICVASLACDADAQATGNPVVTITGVTSGGLKLRRLATVSTDRFAPNYESPALARSVHGKFLIVDHTRTQIGVFDREGNLERIFGRNGSGPGEFRSITAVLKYRGDSLVILDGRRRTATVVDPTATRAVRSFSLPSHLSAESINGSFLLAAGFADEKRVGYPLHIVSSTGVWKGALGLPLDRYTDQKRLLRFRVFSVDSTGSSVAVSDVAQYRFSTYDSTLSERSTFVRALPWFTASDQNLWERGTLYPRALIQAIKWIGSTKVMVAVARPTINNPKQLTDSPNGKESVAERRVGLEDYQEFFKTVFERVDLKARRVEGSLSLSGLVGSVVGSPYWWRILSSADGESRLEIFEVVP